MRSIVVQPEALHETEDAFAWYEDKDPGLGFRFLHDLEVAYAAIARCPELSQPVRRGFRRALLRKFPYAIFFESDRQLVVIHSVFHCSRDPAIWQSRLTISRKKL